MNIPKNIYIGLMIAFVVLILIAFGLMYAYNEARKEKVAELQSQGYICTQNEFGFYERCTKPELLNKYNVPLNLSIGGQNG